MRHTLWIINHYAVPPQLPGGTRHYEFARHLSCRGYTVVLWLSLFQHGLYKYIDRETKQKISGELPEDVSLRWTWSPPYRGNDWLRVLNMCVFAFLVFCRGLISPAPRTILASSPHLFAALAGWALSKVKGCGFLLEIRDAWPDGLVVLGLGSDTLVYKLLHRLAHFLYRRSSRVIVLTEGLKDILERQGVEPDKITYLPNGISMDYLQGRDEREKNRRDLGFGDKFICLYAGAHGPNNALETVLEAAALLNKNEKILFVFIGDGPEKGKLQIRAREMKLPNVIFHDAVPKSKVLPVLYAADAALLSIRDLEISRGVRPNKLFDYLAAGRPVICAGYGESMKLVDELRVGVCCRPEDPVDLAGAVCRAYADREELTARAAVNGPQYVARHASREKMTDLLDELIIRQQTGLHEAAGVFIMTSHRWDDPRIFHKQACSLAEKYEVELHAPADGGYFQQSGVRVCPLRRYGTPYMRPLNWCRLFYRGCRSRARVIHLHDPELLPVGYAIKRLTGKKLIYDVHENFAATIEYKPWLPALVRPVLVRLLGGMEKWFARRADALVLAIPYFKQLFTTSPGVAVEVVYNYPKPEMIPDVFEHKESREMILFYAGVISRPRGVLQMVQAIARVDWRGMDFRLLLAGPIRPPGLQDEITLLVSEKGLQGKVIITGPLPLADVYSLLPEAGLGLALLHPEKNYVHSLPTKIIEYMAAGLPVVASDFPDWIELVEGNGCGYNVDPLDEKAVAKSIERIVHNPVCRRQMGMNGRRAFEQKYNWRLEGKKLLSLYKNLIPKNGGVRSE